MSIFRLFSASFWFFFRSQTKSYLENIKDLNSALSILKTENIALIQCNLKLQQELNKMKFSTVNTSASVCTPVTANTSASVCTPVTVNTSASVNTPVIVNTLASVNTNTQLSVNNSVYGNGNIPACAIQKETHPFDYSIESQMKLRAENRWLDDSFDEHFEEEQETILGIKNPHSKEEEVAQIRALWDDDDEEESNVLFSGKMLY